MKNKRPLQAASAPAHYFLSLLSFLQVVFGPAAASRLRDPCVLPLRAAPPPLPLPRAPGGLGARRPGRHPGRHPPPLRILRPRGRGGARGRARDHGPALAVALHGVPGQRESRHPAGQPLGRVCVWGGVPLKNRDVRRH